MRHDTDCHVDALEVHVDAEALERADTIFLAVGGLGCPNCAARVRNQLLRTEGVLAAELTHENSLARVWYESDRVTSPELCRAVARAAEGTHHDYRAVPVASRFG
jgi:copper chaperone CopZ